MGPRFIPSFYDGWMRHDESLALDPATTPADPVPTAPANPANPPARGRRDPAPWVRRVVVTGLLLAAVNLRPGITSLGALLKEVRDGLGMSGTMAGLLTSVPSFCFALFGFAAPRLARRYGPGAVICA